MPVTHNSSPGGGSQTGSQIKTAYEAQPNAFTDTKDAKLTAIAPGATANSSDSTLLDRSNQTGTQPMSTVTNTAGITDHWTGTQAAYDLLGTWPSTTAYWISG